MGPLETNFGKEGIKILVDGVYKGSYNGRKNIWGWN